MFVKKIKKEELEELKERSDLISQHVRIIQALETSRQLYLNKILPKYGCEIQGGYEVDLKTGRITKIKPENKGENKK